MVMRDKKASVEILFCFLQKHYIKFGRRGGGVTMKKYSRLMSILLKH